MFKMLENKALPRSSKYSYSSTDYKNLAVQSYKMSKQTSPSLSHHTFCALGGTSNTEQFAVCVQLACQR